MQRASSPLISEIGEQPNYFRYTRAIYHANAKNPFIRTFQILSKWTVLPLAQVALAELGIYLSIQAACCFYQAASCYLYPIANRAYTWIRSLSKRELDISSLTQRIFPPVPPSEFSSRRPSMAGEQVLFPDDQPCESEDDADVENSSVDDWSTDPEAPQPYQQPPSQNGSEASSWSDIENQPSQHNSPREENLGHVSEPLELPSDLESQQGSQPHSRNESLNQEDSWSDVGSQASQHSRSSRGSGSATDGSVYVVLQAPDKKSPPPKQQNGNCVIS